MVSQEIEYGAVISSALKLFPSSLNWTPLTPTLSFAVAETVTEEPETVAPSNGAVIETVGLTVSPAITYLNTTLVVWLAETFC
mgnify:CR=1 FL=1